MGDLFKPKEKKKTDTTTTTRQIAAEASPFIGQAQTFLSQATPYSGNRVADFDPLETEAFGMIENLAREGSPLVPATQTAVLGGLNFADPFMSQFGGFGTAGGLGLLDTAMTGGGANPFLTDAIGAVTDPLFERFATETAPGLAAMFSGQGRLRGGGGLPAATVDRATQAFGRGVGQAGLPILAQSAENQAQRALAAQSSLAGFLGQGSDAAARAEALRQGAVGQAPGAFGFGFAPAAMLQSVGEQRRALEQAEIQGRIDRQNEMLQRAQISGGLARALAPWVAPLSLMPSAHSLGRAWDHSCSAERRRSAECS